MRVPEEAAPQVGKLKELAVHHGHARRRQVPQNAAQNASHHPDTQTELDEMCEDLPVGIAERLERADDRPLLPRQTRDQYVEHQGRNQQEDPRNDGPNHRNPELRFGEVYRVYRFDACRSRGVVANTP